MNRVATPQSSSQRHHPAGWARCCATSDPGQSLPGQMPLDPLQKGTGEGGAASAWLSPSSGVAQAIYLRLPALKTLLSKLAVTPR